MTQATVTRWLSESEQRAWRNWLTVTTQLSAALHRQLQGEFDLSLQDFGVLVQLSEAGGERLRASELAESLQWERSRLSHHIKRMEKRGLVRREECPDDGRGAFVVLTTAGREAIERAAPSHVATVREIVFDALTEAEVEAFTATTAKILARIHAG
jgi:DNA-binding MarR family transcriptional regulator